MIKQQTGKSGTNARPGTSIPPFPIQLIDVRLREVHAELAEIEEDTEDLGSKISVGTEEHPSQERFFATLRLDTQRRAGEGEIVTLTVAVEGAFETVEESGETDEEAVHYSVERDIVVLLWPYLREQVHSLTRRMRLRIPPLPVVDVRTLIEEGESGESVSDSG